MPNTSSMISLKLNMYILNLNYNLLFREYVMKNSNKFDQFDYLK